jgi:hypothetical protein
LSNANRKEDEEFFRFFETSAGPDPYLAHEKSKPRCTTLPCAVGFFALGMKRLRLSGLLACLVFFTRPGCAEQPPLAEKIQDISPDKKFAMRIRYDAEAYRKMFPENWDAGKASAALQRGIKEEYFSATIKAIELISLPQKLVVAELPWDGNADQTSLTWSRDSKWCAFYASTARWGLTWVYHLRGDQFIPVSENEKPGVNVEGDARGTWATPLEIDGDGRDVRREWLQPMRWIKPGVLLLEQSPIFRGADSGEATYRFTAKFDEKTGKFQIISQKKVPSKE